jgi:hypothetical protein
MGEMRNEYNTLIEKSEEKRTLRRHGHRWEDNIITDLRETGWKIVGWIHLAQDRDQWQTLVNMVMNLRFRWGIS